MEIQAETGLENKRIELQNEREKWEHELRVAEAANPLKGVSEMAMMIGMWTRMAVSRGAHELNTGVHGWKHWQIA